MVLPKVAPPPPAAALTPASPYLGSHPMCAPQTPRLTLLASCTAHAVLQVPEVQQQDLVSVVWGGMGLTAVCVCT